MVALEFSTLMIMVMDAVPKNARLTTAKYGQIAPAIIGVFLIAIVSFGRVPNFSPIKFTIGDLGGVSSEPVEYSVAQLTVSFLIAGETFAIYNVIFQFKHHDEFRYVSHHPKVHDEQRAEDAYMFAWANKA